jgi:hypothetical protein
VFNDLFPKFDEKVLQGNGVEGSVDESSQLVLKVLVILLTFEIAANSAVYTAVLSVQDDPMGAG